MIRCKVVHDKLYQVNVKDMGRKSHTVLTNGSQNKTRGTKDGETRTTLKPEVNSVFQAVVQYLHL